jgi:predicted NAD/FAD-binding protein
VRIAIVGTGISGLVAAHLLSRNHDIDVFEADGRIGGHTHTVNVSDANGPVPVDTGFIVHNERTYPLFTRLLGRLQVETAPTEMGFSVACQRTGVEWASHGLGSVFAQRRNLLRPAFLRMLRDVLRFNTEARRLLYGEEKASIGDYLTGGGYSREFVDLYIVPMGAAIWSASPEAFLDFPAASFVRFFHNHGLLERPPGVSWRVIRGGSSRYVEALTAPFEHRIHRSLPVFGVRRENGFVSLLTGDGRWRRFDRVVLAVHSDQALALLEQPSSAELRILGAIRYQENQALLHTDPAAMPRRRAAWASWNYRIPAREQQRVFVTYPMNRLQRLESERDYFVSLNAGSSVDPERVLRSIEYHHPVFDADALAAQKLHDRIDGGGGVHYCGAYWGWGFHEDGVRSAQTVALRLGGDSL